jgi:hypothetical protein
MEGQGGVGGIPAFGQNPGDFSFERGQRAISSLCFCSESDSSAVVKGTGNPMYVYVIASSELGPVKIGRGNDPKKRLALFQTGNPDSLEIHHSEPVGYISAAVESEAHRVLASTRISDGGKEWFAVTPAEARIVVRSVARAFELISDKSKTLLEISDNPTLLWNKLHEEYNDYCSDLAYPVVTHTR